MAAQMYTQNVLPCQLLCQPALLIITFLRPLLKNNILLFKDVFGVRLRYVINFIAEDTL